MTRDEFEATLKQARQFGGFGLDPFFESLLAHDTEQREEIEQLKARLDLVGTDFTANMAYQGQLEKCNADLMQQIATLREALEVLLEHLEDDCRLDHHGYCQNHFVTIPCVYKQAQQALKEVK